MQRWPKRLVLLALSLGILTSWFHQSGYGQEVTRNAFLPAPRALRQRLSRARQAVAEERFGDAVLEIAPILIGSDDGRAIDGAEPQDFFLQPDTSGDAQQSIKSEAQLLLGSMPRRGLELYELQFGADARALLDEAAQETDFDKLNAVVRRYFHTQAGYEAMVLLGRLHLDRGQPLAAALCFQRILAAPAAQPKYDPEISVLLAVCWHIAGRPQRAVETLVPLREKYPRSQLLIGGSVSDPLPEKTSVLAWLSKHFPAGQAISPHLSEWLVHRGDATRNASANGGMPLKSLRWRAPTAEFPTDESLISEIRSGRLSDGESSVSSLSPIAVDNVVVMRSPDRMLAIDFATGKRIWEYPWFDSNFPLVAEARRGDSLNHEMDIRKEQLQQRLWRDTPYGQISSDGASVFLLDNLRYAPLQARTSPIPRLGGRGFSMNWSLRQNRLVALNLARQGALKWMVGDTGLDEPKLAGAFFLGTPLPMRGELYTLAELNGEIRLVVLDAESGRLRWSQQLAHIDAAPIVDNQLRRLSGAAPSFGDGILVCPTSAGAVVAIELASRSLLWGYQYSPAVTPSQLRLQAMRRRTTPVANPWLDATATIAEGAVVLTPAESNKIFCLDLLTGNPRWTPLHKSGDLADLQFVACVYRGKIIVVGKHGVLAIGLRDGKPAWQRHLLLDEERGEMASGRGFQSGRYYFLPTTASRLLKVDLEEGKIVEETTTNQTLGNLICYKDEVISQGTDFLTTFYQIEPLHRRVEDRLQSTPDDSWALARRGELLINSGELGPAIVSLRRAYQLQPDDVAARALLVKTLLAALEEDFVEYRSVASELEQLIDRPGQKLEYLRLMGSGLHASGDLRAAAERYLELVEVVSADIRGQQLSAIETIQVDDTTMARIDRWLTVRLAELSRAADTALTDWLDEQIGARWEEAAGGSTEDLQRFLAFFGFHQRSGKARVEFAQRLAAEDRYLEAELSISQLANSGSTDLAVTAAASVASSLSQRGKDQFSRHFYRLLEKTWPGDKDIHGTTGREHVAAASPAVKQLFRQSSSWNWGRVKESTSAGRQLPRKVISIPIINTRSLASTEPFTVAYDARNEAEIVVRDPAGRLVSTTLVSNSTPTDFGIGLNYAHRNGRLLVAVLGDKLLAIDTLSENRDGDSLLWSDRFAQRLTRSATARQGNYEQGNPFDPLNSKVYFVKDGSGKPIGTLGPVTSSGVVFLKSRTLTCVDPLTGSTMWTRQNVERGSEVFGDDDYIFVAARKGQTATVLNARDGSLMGTRSVPPNRWTTHGRQVVAWQSQDDSTRLFVYDAWDEKDVWSESFATHARGFLTESAVAVMEPGGRFQIRRLAGGEVEVETNLEAEESLRTIYLLSSPDQHLLVTDRMAQPRNVREVTGGLPAPLVRGRVYAFSRADGEMLWQSPARIEDFGLPIHQPTAAPTLWFLRQQNLTTRTGQRNRRMGAAKASILCLDRRDGRIIFARNEVTISTSSYTIEADPDEQMVRLLLPGKTFDLEFTEEEMPPEPPAHSTQVLQQVRPATAEP